MFIMTVCATANGVTAGSRLSGSRLMPMMILPPGCPMASAVAAVVAVASGSGVEPAVVAVASLGAVAAAVVAVDPPPAGTIVGVGFAGWEAVVAVVPACGVSSSSSSSPPHAASSVPITGAGTEYGGPPQYLPATQAARESRIPIPFSSNSDILVSPPRHSRVIE